MTGFHTLGWLCVTPNFFCCSDLHFDFCTSYFFPPPQTFCFLLPAIALYPPCAPRLILCTNLLCYNSSTIDSATVDSREQQLSITLGMSLSLSIELSINQQQHTHTACLSVACLVLLARSIRSSLSFHPFTLLHSASH